MTNENIFSGLKVVDLSSFIAGPAAAVILSDYGADVIKVEPPTGDTWRIVYKLPPQPRSHDNYPWHLDNRNKRGMTLDLKSPHAAEILERLVKWADVLIVNTPHPARKKLKLEYEDVAPVESPAGLCGSDRLRRKRTRRQPSRIRYHSLLGQIRLAVTDPGCRRSTHAPAVGQWRPRHGRYFVFCDCHGPVPARANRKGFVRHDVAPRCGSLVLWPLRSGRALRRLVLPSA